MRPMSIEHRVSSYKTREPLLITVARALLIGTTIGLTLLFGSRAAAASIQTHTQSAAPVASTLIERSDLTGSWQGDLDVGGATLRVVVHLEADDEDGYTATMDSPDQGATGIPVAEAVFDDGVLRLSIPSVGAEYKGRLDDEDGVIRGHFTQRGVRLELDLERVDEVTVPSRPQTPEPPFPYDEEEVRYPNPEAGIELAGTLALPHSTGPHAAVLLITGSGALDRDETIAGHKPFHVISDHLARHGIAVLRVDDRGVGGSGGDVTSSTSLDFATDVAAGVEFLRARPEIDGARIGLIGHSEGGLIAPLVAADSDAVAFIVLLAGPGLPGEELLILQSEQIMRAEGAPEAIIATNQELQATIFEVIRAEPDAERRRSRLRETITRELEGPARVLAPDSASREALIEDQTTQSASEWFRFFVMHDPRPVLEQVRVPVLALNGGNDLQVPATENLEAIEAALRAGGNETFEVRELPGLNHLFQTSETGSPAEYGRIEETFAPIALEALSGWILEVIGER